MKRTLVKMRTEIDTDKNIGRKIRKKGDTREKNKRKTWGRPVKYDFECLEQLDTFCFFPFT